MSDGVVAPELTAGTLLRQAREAAGLHVAALAVSLKVPVRKLEALEADRYGDLPDAVFARALAASVCRNLKIDPQPVMSRLPQTTAPRLVQDHEGINTPFRAPGDAVAAGWQQQLMRPVPLAVGALLLGAVAILLLPTLRLDGFAAAAPEAPAVPMAASVVVQPGAAARVDAPAAGDGPAPAAGSTAPAADPAAGAGATTASVPAAAASGTEAATAAAPSPVPAPAAAETIAPPAGMAASIVPAAPVPASGGLVVFKASGPSWVQVIDGRGEVALRRLLGAGESAAASGSLPLSVTVGSVNSTSVQVRGRPFDMAGLERDNVARFQVK